MKCAGCGSGHVQLDETWTKKGSLTRGYWAPYYLDNIYEGFHGEGYCSSCVAKNSRAGYVNQVTPRNQLWKHAILKDVNHRYPQNTKEGFQGYGVGMVHNAGHDTYHTIHTTWEKQPRYTTD